VPVITIEAAALSKEQKYALVATLTKEAAGIMNVAEQHFMVLIKENSRENIGVGGVLLADR
jgi:4-oxalocrotonate tautomerase